MPGVHCITKIYASVIVFLTITFFALKLRAFFYVNNQLQTGNMVLFACYKNFHSSSSTIDVFLSEGTSEILLLFLDSLQKMFFFWAGRSSDRQSNSSTFTIKRTMAIFSPEKFRLPVKLRSIF